MTRKEKHTERLRGAIIILDSLHANCVPTMGKAAADRITAELEHYLGEEWYNNELYKTLRDDGTLLTSQELKEENDEEVCPKCEKIQFISNEFEKHMSCEHPEELMAQSGDLVRVCEECGDFLIDIEKTRKMLQNFNLHYK